MVMPGNGKETRARSGPGSLHPERSCEHRALAEALGGPEPAPEVGSLPLRDGDAHLLHQSVGEDAGGGATPAPRVRQGRAPAALQAAASEPTPALTRTGR